MTRDGPPADRTDLNLRVTVVVFTAAVVLPLIVHAIPDVQGVSWGERLLPMYYACFIAVAFYPLHTGLIAATLAPLALGIITGLPDDDLVIVLTVELAAFTVLSYWLMQRRPRLSLSAPIAYILAHTVAFSVGLVLPFVSVGGIDALLPSFFHAAPGLVILFLLNIFAARATRLRSTS